LVRRLLLTTGGDDAISGSAILHDQLTVTVTGHLNVARPVFR